MKITFLDGAFGTELQRRGLAPGEIPEEWNLTHADKVREIHQAYFDAGADIVYTNTFGATREKYHGDFALRDIISAAVENVRAVAPEGARVSLDLGPTGRLLKPAGHFDFYRAYDAFAESVRLGAEAGADLVTVETFNDTYELKAAILAARENCDLPVHATVALSEDGKLLTGADVDTVAALFNALRVDAAGFNCGLGPDRLLPFVERLASRTNLPIVVKANAGLPRVVDGQTRFDVTPQQFASDMLACVKAGAAMVGGCCGTTPAHIAALCRAIEEADVEATERDARLPVVVSSFARTVELPLGDSIVIGERINPTGKKKLKEAYKAGDTAYVLREAVAQVEAGAHILDVNAGVPGIDEPRVLRETVEAIQGVTDVPLQIDTADVVALEGALRHYNGVALVNSVNGKAETMDAVLPLVAKYGGVVVALTLDEQGIPPTAEGRVAIAQKILERGRAYGLVADDFVIDVLCLAVSADPNSVNVILESLRRIRTMGLRTVLGVSNVSFGLPARPLLNGTFYSLALEAGLTSAIVNPLSLEMMTAYRSWRALTGRDGSCADWIAAVAAGQVGATAAVAAGTGPSAVAPAPSAATLRGAIVHGLKADAARFARELLDGGQAALALIDGEIVPALEVVGKGFEAKRVFLPQLLMAAEAASAAFEVIRGALEKSGQAGEPKGPIVLATVKGDIHDIGKNIVRALLENYGFRVIDLGRDVAPEQVVEAAQKAQCRLVGLSALMTTTVGAMAETIRQLNAADPEIMTFVGGAVLTADYAAEIKATWYAKDAMASVRIAEGFFAGA